MEVIEEWRDINEFKEYYQVSNLGRVRSKDRYTIGGQGIRISKGKIITPFPNSNGYLRVGVAVNGIKEKRFVHRLVAEAFCENPDNYTVVNHLDSDHTNNRFDNLEWTTFMGNMRHAIGKGRFLRTEMWLKRQRDSLKKYDKPVIGTNIKTGEELKFASIKDAARNGFTSSLVCLCCKGKQQTHKGYTWKYAN